MGCDIPLRKGLIQFHAHEGAGGIAGDGGVVVLEHVAIHVRIIVYDILVDPKRIVVNEHAHPFSYLLAAADQQIAQRGDVFPDPQVMSLQVDKEDVAGCVVTDTVRQ